MQKFSEYNFESLGDLQLLLILPLQRL